MDQKEWFFMFTITLSIWFFCCVNILCGDFVGFVRDDFYIYLITFSVQIFAQQKPPKIKLKTWIYVEQNNSQNTFQISYKLNILFDQTG